MKENYYHKAIEFGNLYQGLKTACKDVRWKDSVVGYEYNGLKNTYKLQQELLNDKYRISKYQVFEIFEPKRRTIVATRLRDRQFQTSLCKAGLYEDISEHFIRDNCACQKGKGLDDAIRRLKVHMRKFYNQHGQDGWVLKCDIKKFFQSTQHSVAHQAIDKYVSDKDAANRVHQVIDSFEGDTGIGLGSQISQLIEMAVLNDFDHYIKEQLHIKHYIRYMDDFILIHEDEEYLKYCRRCIENKLSEMGFRLNEKTCLYPLKHGVVFLQWRFAYTDTGKLLMLMNNKRMSKQRRKLRKLIAKEAAGEIPKGTAVHSLQCWLSYAKRGNTYKQRKAMTAFFEEEMKKVHDNKEALKKMALERAARRFDEVEEVTSDLEAKVFYNIMMGTLADPSEEDNENVE